MGWTRKTQRLGRGRCRPWFESLENRCLLSATPVPAEIQPLASISNPVPVQSAFTAPGSSPFDSITGASRTRATYGVDGTGLAAAVIDTGVNYRHEALGGRFGPGAKVEAGYDFADHDNDPDATWQHGTAVAGLIASSDPAHPGVAPGADIAALRVFGNNNQGDYKWIADALQWVVDNHDRYGITVVNLSISDEHNYTLNWFAHDGGVGQRITTLIQKLDDLNIPVVSAAGNSFQGQQGMGFTAIVGDTISVTSSDGSDHLAGNAQRLGAALGGSLATDLAAPGEGVTAPVDGNSFITVGGSSFATSLVTGAVILLQQIYLGRFGHLPTVSQVDAWLKAGSDPINDSATGITLGRLDIAKAAGLIPSPPKPTPAPPAPQPPAPAPVVTAVPLNADVLWHSLTFTTFRVPPPTPPRPPAPVQPLPTAPVSTPSVVVQTPAPAPVQPLTPAPVQPPATSPATTHETQVVLDGQPVGTISASSKTTDLLSSFLSGFSFPGTLQQVHIWTPARLKNTAGLRAHPDGYVARGQAHQPLTVRIETRRDHGAETASSTTGAAGRSPSTTVRVRGPLAAKGAPRSALGGFVQALRGR